MQRRHLEIRAWQQICCDVRPDPSALDTPAGRRYRYGAQEGWQFQLFVRARKSEPYRACGPMQMESIEGDRPMTIVWRFASALPMKLFREFSVLRGV